MRNAPPNMLAIVLLTLIALPIVGCGGCLLLVGMVGQARTAARSATRTTSHREPVRYATEDVQRQRAALVRRTIEQGLLQRIRVLKPAAPRAFVTPQWYSLDFDTKQSFAGLWAAWEYRTPLGESLRNGQRLVIVDAMTGKEIAVVTKDGLDIY